MTTLPNPVDAPKNIHAILDRLHRQSEVQEAGLQAQRAAILSNASSNGRPESPSATVDPEYTKLMADKFIALDKDKSQFVYQLMRATQATNVVEAGTSYGVSTIYLALAVGQNKAATGKSGAVIATEHEPEKAAKAREHWRECGSAVESHIDLRVGDILETLKSDMPQVDLLLLDIWTPLALPVLKLVQPHLRHGAVVFTDNPISSAKGYGPLLSYLRSPENGFSNSTLPFNNGLEMSVYLPK